MDGNLTQWEHSRRTYPHPSVRDSFTSMATDLDNATLALKDLHPEATGLMDNLKEDTLNLGVNAGMTGAMSRSSSVFGSGWSRDLDSSIEDTRQALDLATQPAEPGQSTPPDPLEVLKDLSDVQADLTRWDASFTQWQNSGRIYPSPGVSQELKEVAGALYDARDAVRALHPDQTELLKSLQKDIIKVASNAGTTRHMSSQSSTFGRGWRETMDGPISDVRQAIDVIAEV